MMLILAGLSGCAAPRAAATRDRARAVFILPGVGGTSGYSGIVQAVRTPASTAQIISWGAPSPLFFLNFSNKSIHDAAENRLLRRILDFRQAHPRNAIDLIGHSAGCGVILGALARLDPDVHVHNVILLAPSVSPAYDLRPAIAHIDGALHVFYSGHDTLFLSWRTSHFGTYDRIKTPAAGNTGFTANLPGKLIQHAYDPSWRALGNDGGHFGTLAKPFAERVIAPLLAL